MINEIKIIVQEVGQLLLDWRSREIFDGNWQGTQFKARVDLMAHNELEERLRCLDPAIPIISEENPASLCRNRPALYWLIDPIDGTASFVHGFDGFVTQVALVEDGEPVMSAIYAPVSQSLYWAQQGKGSFRNKQRLTLVDNCGALTTLIDNYPEPRGVAGQIFNDFGLLSYIECGSIALKICMVAAGRADLFVKDVVVRDWDLAAPQLVIEESGGVLNYINGTKPVYKDTFEHTGIIATRSDKISQRIVEWYNNSGRSR